MYIEASYSHSFPARTHTNPRERYQQYYRDLHHRYKIPLEEATCLTGSQYQFSEMAYPIFDALREEGRLASIDTLVLTHWAQEYDPDYATLGPHLAHRYGISGNLFDVVDHGNFCSMITLSLIKKLNTKKALCIALDQTTVPRSDAVSFRIPEKTASVALYLSNEKPEKNSLKIIDVELWPERLLADAKFNLVQLISDLLNKNNIPIQDCVLSCKRNGTAYRAINLYQSHDNEFEIEFHFLPIQTGCTDVFQYIHALSNHSPAQSDKKNASKQYHLYLEEDVESLTSGLIILEKI